MEKIYEKLNSSIFKNQFTIKLKLRVCTTDLVRGRDVVQFWKSAESPESVT